MNVSLAGIKSTFFLGMGPGSCRGSSTWQGGGHVTYPLLSEIPGQFWTRGLHAHSVLGPAKHGGKDSALTILGGLQLKGPERYSSLLQRTCSFSFLPGLGAVGVNSLTLSDGELRPKGKECIHDTGFHM